jgi:hypothetical protein
MWENPRRAEAAIKRFTREIDEFDRFFYRVNENDDRASYAHMLERKREDMVRSAVLHIHTVDLFERIHHVQDHRGHSPSPISA